MPTERTYSVTYVSADGEQKMETITGRCHVDVERQIKRRRSCDVNRSRG